MATRKFGTIVEATQAEVDAGVLDSFVGVRIVIVDAGGAPTGATYESGAANAPPVVSSAIKNNFTSTVAPAVTDDSGDGYSVGSRWIDTTGDESYICLDATVGAAVWVISTANTIGEIVGLRADLDNVDGGTF